MNARRSVNARGIPLLLAAASVAACTGLPDLVVQPAPAPAGYCRDYDTRTIRVMVMNQGKEGAPATTTSVTFSRGDYRQTFPTPALAPGDTTVVGPVDVHNCPGSICSLIIRVDDGDVVGEEDESNNESTATCTPPA